MYIANYYCFATITEVETIYILDLYCFFIHNNFDRVITVSARSSMKIFPLIVQSMRLGDTKPIVESPLFSCQDLKFYSFLVFAITFTYKVRIKLYFSRNGTLYILAVGYETDMVYIHIRFWQIFKTCFCKVDIVSDSCMIFFSYTKFLL